MPEQPLPKRHPQTDGRVRKHAVCKSYAELHCRSNFSFLEGASHADELIQRAAELNYEALAITDRNSLAGVVRAHVAAKTVGLKLLVGAEITPEDAWPVVLFATDRAAYGRLAHLITVGRRRAEKGSCRLTLKDVARFQQGLLACVVLTQGITKGRSSALHRSARQLDQYHEIFGDRCYALAELHRGPDDPWRLQAMNSLAREVGVPLVAANDVHYHLPCRQALQDVLCAIRHGSTVADLGHRRFPNAQRYLKAPQEMAELFADFPDAVRRTVELAHRCSFSLDELRYEYPHELGPPGVMPLDYLEKLTWKGAGKRYPNGIPPRVRQLIEHELQLIKELRYEAYFLTVWDLVRFARQRGILCQGRGSAANSVICFCLGVTSVDPEQIDVLFERFVSKERNEAPDIDVDFEHERREEVLQYLYEKYGRERAGIAATVITYRPRSAVRDVGKALGLSLDRVDVIAKSLERYSHVEELSGRLGEAGLNGGSTIARQLVELSQQILEFPRHLSQHVGGMVMTAGPLCELVPIENAAMPGRTVVQWDKDDLEALGILKVDCLSLGMLTAIQKAFGLIHQHQHRRFTLASVPQDDPAVYEMIQRADTIGVFQIESRAQMSMLPRLRPNCYYDLVIEVSIVRPGPIQGNMVHPYLRRRQGKEKPEYPSEAIKAVLEKTLGVPIFQEQAMRLAVVGAGFTPGEADQLRRAMGAWRRPGIIDDFRKKLIEGMLANGHSADFAERLFNQIRGFGEYGFPESHAASFALLVYVSAWIKHYYPAAFAAALLNSQPMGFYAPAQLVADARKHGVSVLPADVNFSSWDCTLEAEPNHEGAATSSPQGSHSAELPNRPGRALRLGLRMIQGLSQTHGQAIVEARSTSCQGAGCHGFGRFASFSDFTRRTGLSNAVLKRLSRADTFRSLDLARRDALWRSLADPETPPLFENVVPEEPVVELPAMQPYEEVAADYQTIHLSLRGHPLQFIRSELEELGVVPARRLPWLPADRRYKVAGLVLMRQRPSTAKGITFVTLEDDTGTVNLIIRQDVWERYRKAAFQASVMLAGGRLQREREVIHILADQLEDISHLLAAVPARSRDFR
jgi:error-prone DNA polymerase